MDITTIKNSPQEGLKANYNKIKDVIANFLMEELKKS